MLGWILLILFMLASLGFIYELLEKTSPRLNAVVLAACIAFFIFIIYSIQEIERV